MFRKIVSLVLTLLLAVATNSVTAFAESSAEKEAQQTAKIKASIQALGTGEKAKAKLKLKDGTKLEGYVSAANDESFVLTNAKTATVTTVTYPQVKQVKGHNLSTGTKVAIGVGILAAVAFAIVLAKGGDIELSNR